MVMELHKLSPESFQWFTEVASVRMLTEELKRPELVNLESIRELSHMLMRAETAWVVKKDGEYIGAVASVIVPNMYNPNIKTLSELMWYIIPEHRKSRAGYMLLKQLEETGRESADEILLSTIPSSAINMSTLVKRGFIHVENVYRKVV
jgi:hypothetical protein